MHFLYRKLESRWHTGWKSIFVHCYIVWQIALSRRGPNSEESCSTCRFHRTPPFCPDYLILTRQNCLWYVKFIFYAEEFFDEKTKFPVENQVNERIDDAGRESQPRHHFGIPEVIGYDLETVNQQINTKRTPGDEIPNRSELDYSGGINFIGEENSVEVCVLSASSPFLLVVNEDNIVLESGMEEDGHQDKSEPCKNKPQTSLKK